MQKETDSTWGVLLTMSTFREYTLKGGTLGTVSLLVAGGSEITRKGLCALFRQQPGWEVAAEACDGREAIETARQINPDIAIIDIDMPWLNGLEASASPGGEADGCARHDSRRHAAFCQSSIPVSKRCE